MGNSRVRRQKAPRELEVPVMELISLHTRATTDLGCKNGLKRPG